MRNSLPARDKPHHSTRSLRDSEPEIDHKFAGMSIFILQQDTLTLDKWFPGNTEGSSTNQEDLCTDQKKTVVRHAINTVSIVSIQTAGTTEQHYDSTCVL